MRTGRLILASTISVALLAGLSSVGAAQSEDGPMVVPVTGRLTDMAFVAEADHTREQVGPVTEYRMTEFDWTIDWSDPRLPTNLRLRESANEYPPSHANAVARPMVSVGAVADGAGEWVGTSTVVFDEEDRISGHTVLEGIGVNDGLVAILGVSADSGDSAVWDGFLIHGELPPLPEPSQAELSAD